MALKMLAASALGELDICAAENTGDPILGLDGHELLARIRDGSLRAEQVCARFLEQYERERSLNAVTWINPSSVLERAREIDLARRKGTALRPLAGLPILVKDNIDTVGFPTSAGTPSLKGHVSRRNAPVVDRLVQQGAIVMGKANMHELAAGGTSSNSTFGFVRNPYNTQLIPGGSSGGSAAAVAAHIAPVALGTDSGGSVRIPAAFCGIVGFRPSTYPRKLYSQQGVVPGAHDLDTIGPMGRCVADVVLLHETIVGPRWMRPLALATARIGLPNRGFWEDLDPQVERVCRAALTRLVDQGAVLVEVDLAKVKETAEKVFSALVSGAIADLENYLRTQVPSVSLSDLIGQIASRDVRAAVEGWSKAGPAPDLLKARGAGREALRTAYEAVFRQHNIEAIVFPTEVLPAPPIQESGDDPDRRIEFNGCRVSMGILARNTLLAPVVGAPALSLPAGLTSAGLPVALEFDGLPGTDRALLALGQAAEAALGRLPPLHVARLSTEDRRSMR